MGQSRMRPAIRVSTIASSTCRLDSACGIPSCLPLTALLLSGVLHVQQYFNQENAVETEIRTLADALYRRIDWAWMQVRPPKIGHGWHPETGFLPYDWSGYNEATILYLLALGSPTLPVSDAAWRAWTSTYAWQSHYGFDFVVPAALWASVPAYLD